jgi:hypothetical protein
MAWALLAPSTAIMYCPCEGRRVNAGMLLQRFKIEVQMSAQCKYRRQVYPIAKP